MHAISNVSSLSHLNSFKRKKPKLLVRNLLKEIPLKRKRKWKLSRPRKRAGWLRFGD